jgi:hypothetical protein
MLSGCDAQADVVKDDGIATGYVDVLHVEEFGLSLGGAGQAGHLLS